MDQKIITALDLRLGKLKEQEGHSRDPKAIKCPKNLSKLSDWIGRGKNNEARNAVAG